MRNSAKLLLPVLLALSIGIGIAASAVPNGRTKMAAHRQTADQGDQSAALSCALLFEFSSLYSTDQWQPRPLQIMCGWTSFHQGVHVLVSPS